jgi:Tfp pilus assembly protein PilO
MKFKLTPLNRNLIVMGVLLLVGLFGWFSVLQPKINQVRLSQEQLASLQQNFADLKRVADQKPMYLALTKQIQQRLVGVELTADARAYVPSYLKQVEKLAKRDGLVVTSVIPQPLPVATASPKPGTAGSPNSVANAPVIGGPIKSAARVAGAEGANTQATNSVAAATGATPIPGASPEAAVAPAAGAPSAVGPFAGPVRTPAPGTPRANAIAYVNQSFTQLPINMEMTGTYVQTQKFLRDLNRFPKLVGVSDVTLTPAKSTGIGEMPQLKIVLPIVAYRLGGGPAVAPPAPTPAPTVTPAPAGG